MKITRKTVINTAIVLAMVFLVAAMVLPALTAKRQNSHPYWETRSRLYDIYNSLLFYSVDYEDYLPTRPGYQGFNQMLLPLDYIEDIQLLVAKEDSITPGLSKHATSLLSESATSYAYLGNGMMMTEEERNRSKNDKATPLIISKPWLFKTAPCFAVLSNRQVYLFNKPDKRIETSEEAIQYLAEIQKIDTKHLDLILANAREIDKTRVSENEK